MQPRGQTSRQCDLSALTCLRLRESCARASGGRSSGDAGLKGGAEMSSSSSSSSTGVNPGATGDSAGVSPSARGSPPPGPGDGDSPSARPSAPAGESVGCNGSYFSCPSSASCPLPVPLASPRRPCGGRGGGSRSENSSLSSVSCVLPCCSFDWSFLSLSLATLLAVTLSLSLSLSVTANGSYSSVGFLLLLPPREELFVFEAVPSPARCVSRAPRAVPPPPSTDEFRS